ncbi:MAG: monovalent cation/H(+) antiporter subunit G [Planctomycetes bacterium]|nr:monovalent cation/H(+) antiporter subunit G [Planctomycetota bacterium]MCA8935836.1 monovalent cation/H(+) antiporter subunit G [Planctomycetota bacterium]MCA8946944.1 monovalent cation/H(+) antiporter subunit G [Planctomycetota bacterium]
MQVFLDIVVWVLLIAGGFFSLTAAVGVLRFPDFYTRLHPAGKNDTLGVLLFCSAMLIETMKYDYGYLVAGRLVLMVLFMLMASPIACHAITQAAYVDGLRPWKKGEPRR